MSQQTRLLSTIADFLAAILENSSKSIGYAHVINEHLGTLEDNLRTNSDKHYSRMVDSLRQTELAVEGTQHSVVHSLAQVVPCLVAYSAANSANPFLSGVDAMVQAAREMKQYVQQMASAQIVIAAPRDEISQ